MGIETTASRRACHTRMTDHSQLSFGLPSSPAPLPMMMTSKLLSMLFR